MAVSAVQLRFEIEGALESFRLDESALEAMLRGNAVAGDLSRKAIEVESAAKTFATGVDGGPNVVTGRLRGSITWRLGEDGEGLYADVGTAVSYGFWLEVKDPAHGGRPFLVPALEQVSSEN